MNYYLNAFNEMLRKRQENQMGRGGGQMPQMMGGGGGGDGRSSNPGWDALSNAEKAAYYSDNPTMAAITQGLQKGFGLTSYGMLQNALAPDFVREQGMVARGIDPGIGIQGQGMTGQTGLYGDQFAGETAPKSSGFMDTLGRMFGGSSVSLNPVEVQDRTATPNPYGGVNPSLSSTGSGFAGADVGFGGGFTGGVGTGTSGGSPAEASDLGYNQGGMVTPERLMGRAPAPDDGYGALQGGEYVITKAAVEKYGKAMMDAINNGTFR